MTQWSGYVCKRCGMAVKHDATWQFNCSNCGYLVDPDTAIRVVAIDKAGHLPRRHCPFGDRCRDDCQWYMLNGMCAMKSVANDLRRAIERKM